MMRKITENYPYALLYDADPSKEIVADYLARGECYGLFEHEQLIGTIVLLKTRPKTIEIMNIAILEEKRGLGYGKNLITQAINIAQKYGARTIELGTGNSSVSQLALYQKCGFRMTHIEKDYFTKHYPEPIFENGIECRDMIRLSLNL
ncbi:N-acetyltransferase [Listeria sp. ILCC792]|uniref:GNAT family N-acetyltransferase n=1 Tax=Listeria sp. ILCC792 TaxID=1918331 RepID=UPI000B593197|nr:GNAT family N-acetyltransferase [Listeria sp. ILCC792]